MRFLEIDSQHNIREIPEPLDISGDYRRLSPISYFATYQEDVVVSTVFLRYCYNDEGPPMCFETMVFGGQMSSYTERHSSYDEALRRHNEICEQAIQTAQSDEQKAG